MSAGASRGVARVTLWRQLRVAATLLLTLLTAAAGLTALAYIRVLTTAEVPAPVPPPPPLRALSDLRQVPITLTTPEWTREHLIVTVDRLRTDHTLWRRMHVGDWDRVPEPLRAAVLPVMVRAYRALFDGPSVWQRMSADEWDRIPQPIRAMAYLRMIWYWVRYENVGAEFRVRPGSLAPSVAAIVMGESWFEHRAINENQWGNRDLGLAQCSDYCRATLAEMAERGEISFAIDDSAYFNPWVATRVATIWFERELLLADGDVELAIRAYHRGLDHAMDDRGDAYYARVRRLRETYIATQRASPTWHLLTQIMAPL